MYFLIHLLRELHWLATFCMYPIIPRIDLKYGGTLVFGHELSGDGNLSLFFEVLVLWYDMPTNAWASIILRSFDSVWLANTKWNYINNFANTPNGTVIVLNLLVAWCLRLPHVPSAVQAPTTIIIVALWTLPPPLSFGYSSPSVQQWFSAVHLTRWCTLGASETPWHGTTSTVVALWFATRYILQVYNPLG